MKKLYRIFHVKCIFVMIIVQLFSFMPLWVVSLFSVEMNLKTSKNHRSGQDVHHVMIKMEMWKL